jgi:broad specificity phosphatase PhoE
MEGRSGSGMPDPDQIAELRARADAGDRNAAGRLGELLARRGDLEDAVRVWAEAYGDGSPTTRRLGELLARRGDLESAVRVWQFSDAVWQNPEGLHAEFLAAVSPDELLEWDDGPEDWAFMEEEQLAKLLAERAAAIAELRARTSAGDPVAKHLERLLAEPE